MIKHQLLSEIQLFLVRDFSSHIALHMGLNVQFPSLCDVMLKYVEYIEILSCKCLKAKHQEHTDLTISIHFLVCSVE